jgi:hypothetical protein
MANPIESTPWPWTFRRRVTEVKAWRISHANLQQAAEWAGGHTWAASVVLPGDHVANVGDWIVNANGTFAVVDHGRFVRDFYEVTQ